MKGDKEVQEVDHAAVKLNSCNHTLVINFASKT